MTASTATPEPGHVKKVVLDFFEAWDKDGFVPAFERYMHPDAIWQNTGYPDAAGRDAYMGLLAKYEEFSGAPYGVVEMIRCAVDGNALLTERIDHIYDKNRKLKHSAKIMGIFEVEGDLITRYSDYFDSLPYKEMTPD